MEFIGNFPPLEKGGRGDLRYKTKNPPGFADPLFQRGCEGVLLNQSSVPKTLSKNRVMVA